MSACPAALVTDPVNEAVDTVRAIWRNRELAPADDPALVERLTRVFAVSPWCCQVGSQHPAELGAIVRDACQGLCTVAEHVQALQTALQQRSSHTAADMVTASDEALLLSVLRHYRRRVMLAILWRELAGEASLDETLTALTRLADAAVRLATDWAHQRLAARFGEPRSAQNSECDKPLRLLVIAMGKLGGGELNVSSDIDLIYLYPESGSTDGRRSLDNREFFRRVATLLTRLLSVITEDGFVFRVDTRLRPFGESGPLVTSLDGFEHYLLTQGRDWERFAMIKARSLSGDEQAISRFESLRIPFVYRRYLDYSAFESLRDLKRRIALAVRQRGREDDIKLGTGGIREIEFIGQAMQLVRGGREPRLRLRGTRETLTALAHLGLLSAAEVERLQQAYTLLRRVENALQAMRDEQLHRLPAEPDDQLRVATVLGHPVWRSCRQSIDDARRHVASNFAMLFDDSAEEPASDTYRAAESVWMCASTHDSSVSDVADALNTFGIPPGEATVDTLSSLCRGPFYLRLTARAQQRLDRVLPLVLEQVRDLADPGETLDRALGLLRAVAGRSGYLQVLIDRPHTLARLLRLFSGSAWLAAFVTRHPIVIDELVSNTGEQLLTDRDALIDAVDAEAVSRKQADLEQQMDALRQYQQAYSLRIAVAGMEGALDVMRTSDQLTWLAEAMLAAALKLVQHNLEARHGRPRTVTDGEVHYPEVGIVAYGKLGGLELGFGSDLDIVFVHDCHDAGQQTDGERPIDNAIFFARLAQRLVSFMTTTTSAGVLYPIDLRLRPNGQSGVLVTSIDAFADYQRNQAWTWEHQALVRARLVVGSKTLADRFSQLRTAVLCRKRDADELRRSVHDMRRRMREHLGSSGSDLMNIKQDSGGVADIEFMVQYLLLLHAVDIPQLVQYTDNVRQLDAVVEFGVLAESEADLLRRHYLYLRRRLHAEALQQRSEIVSLDDKLLAVRDAVIAIWQKLMESPNENPER